MGDYYNTIHTAAEEAEKKGHAAGLAEGFTRGWEEGKEEGREEAIKVIAQNLLEKGMSVEDVASITGMSMEDVKAL